MEEEARNKSAIIFIFHKVSENFSVECLWTVKQWKASVIPEAPCSLSGDLVIHFSINHLPRREKVFSFQHFHSHAKVIKIFNSAAEIRRKGVMWKFPLICYFFPLGKKLIQVYLASPQRKPLHSRAGFQIPKKGIFEETLTKA